MRSLTNEHKVKHMKGGAKMKEQYEDAVMEVVVFEEEDIITASDPYEGGGVNPF